MDRLNQAATIGTINPGRAVANAHEIHDNVGVILQSRPMPRGI
jgi:hypothetical protein